MKQQANRTMKVNGQPKTRPYKLARFMLIGYHSRRSSDG